MATITVRASTANLPAVLDFIHAQIKEIPCKPKTLLQIDLAVEELFVNIANYAYGDGEGLARIHCKVCLAPPSITITLTDTGIPFNPLEIPEANTKAKAEERNIGGLGIFLAKKNLDSIHYERCHDENILTLYKTLQS